MRIKSRKVTWEKETRVRINSNSLIERRREERKEETRSSLKSKGRGRNKKMSTGCENQKAGRKHSENSREKGAWVKT